ncbi:MAG: metallophosphoesterase [Candidatus Micrarchaeia archaeon]|jgi:predicted MPP superfamily phosphohydrolase
MLFEASFLLTVTKINLNFSSFHSKLKILHITDLHFGSTPPTIYPIVLSKVKSIKPDIIVITGDLVSTNFSIPQAIEFVNSLSEIAPTFIVFGNWDHWVGLNVKDFNEKIKILLNSNTFIPKNESKICIIGVDDPYSGYDNLEEAILNLNNCSIKILLAHSPQIVGKAAGKVDLILAGHTHGGQICLPGFGALWVPLPNEYKNFVYGLFKVNSTYMFVSRGIGTRLLPLRFFSSPEIVLIEINE